jgi:hypothetical protein
VYEPTSIRLQRVKARLSEACWEKRVAQARLDKTIIDEILAKASHGVSMNTAIAEVVAASRRSWAYRRIPRYREAGFEALIDARTPREAQVTSACRDLLQGARQANPHLTVTQAEAILNAQGIAPLPSGTTIKREFASADAKRREAQKRGLATPEADGEVQRIALPYAGGELMLAAELETGGIAALTAEVVQAGERARAASQGRMPQRDVARRSARGQFTARYNRARRRTSGEVIASYLRSAEEKAQGRVPAWPQFVHESPAAIHGKLSMLGFCSVMEGTSGWGALRSPDMAGLGPLVGYAYMPSTLAKLTSAMAIAGLGPGMLVTLGEHWHGIAEARWGEPGAMAALYVDNHAKEVWSTLFTQAGKVSHRTRVMPCITTTYAHTGAGTPLVMSVQSGSAPLAPRLVQLVEDAEATLGGVVRRAVVIDSEGSTFDILAGFDAADRVIVTPLKPSRAPELELVYSRGSYYRPYRENDELRVATCTLRHKSTERSLELGALLIRRPHHDSDIVLLTTGLRLGLEGRDLADLYFARWPIQEGAFKRGVIVGLNRHRGNCGRMVANVAVVTELEQLEQRAKRDSETRAKLAAEGDALAQAARDTAKESARAQSLLATRRRWLDDLVAEGKTVGKALARVAVEHQQALVRAEACTAAAAKATDAREKNEQRLAALVARIEKTEARVKQLEPQRTIRQLDVAQDTILTAIKLTMAQLIAFALREYLPSMAMVVETFIKRVFSIKGHKEVGRTEERVVFYDNPRDPQVMAALRDACCRLNERGLTRDGRRLRYEVAAAPAEAGDWFG